MNKEIIRWGIIGAGNIAQSFVKDFPLLKNAELVAIAASNIERAKLFATTHKLPQALTYDELYSSEDIDAVYIATTHNFHFEQALKCLQNGKAVLCEKPITVNDKEFKVLMALSKSKKLFLMEAMWTYFLPAIHKAKQWVDEGRIGKLKVVQADFAYPMEKDMQGRMYNPLLAGGALLDLGIYTIALATLFLDKKPDRIAASGVLTESGVDATVVMVLQYEGTTATLCTSMETRMTNKLRLFGENGYIEVPDFWRACACRLFNKEHELIATFEDGRTAHGFIYQMQHATDSILNNEIESNCITHQRTNDIQEIMMEVRRQIGLRYSSD